MKRKSLHASSRSEAQQRFVPRADVQREKLGDSLSHGWLIARIPVEVDTLYQNPFKLEWSKQSHQSANTECGMFSIMFKIL
jgi:hypothetical protein